MKTHDEEADCMKQRGVTLRGAVDVPGDKSITHRSIMFGSIAAGETIVKTTVLGRDNFATARIMRQLGVSISGEVATDLVAMAHEEHLADLGDAHGAVSSLRIQGRGFAGLTAPTGPLDCGNSGTTARLMTGLLAGRPFSATLVGDASLTKRPFRRVVEPLSQMGTEFSGDRMPLTITGRPLRGLHYTSPQASAQVKSAILLAGLQTDQETVVREPRLSRDHTERMFAAMGCELLTRRHDDGSWQVTLPATTNRPSLRGQEIAVPGDFSAAAFFLVAGTIFPNSEIEIRNVGLNPTRIGLLHVLERMGARVALKSKRVVCGEDVVDLVVSAAPLKGVEVTEEDVVLGIDEVPILSVAAAFADGVTRIRGAHELRVKESDRIAMTAAILKTFGVDVVEHEDGLDVYGRPDLVGAGRGALKEELAQAKWRGSGDHRIEMCGAIMELQVTGAFEIADKTAVETSFPNFVSCLRGVIHEIQGLE